MNNPQHIKMKKTDSIELSGCIAVVFIVFIFDYSMAIDSVLDDVQIKTQEIPESIRETKKLLEYL